MKVRLKDENCSESFLYTIKYLQALDLEYPIFVVSGLMKKNNTFLQNDDYITVVKDGVRIVRVLLCCVKSLIVRISQFLIPKDNIIQRVMNYFVKSTHFENYYFGYTVPDIYLKDYQNEQLDLLNKVNDCKYIEKLDDVEDLITKMKEQIKKSNDLMTLNYLANMRDAV